ncbi:uncharacterized protein LTR77_011004 [Saxophila tyrrhenica]|uniref:Uncharacterized protein n=1 Tax=Saxophila tyrrhenica TaxID=1690608 RepID=A0AAV9NU60_9PEZI|nr:hypothetical protein LTR77_011004 [Saxophila tyrrhenica]
MADTYAGYHNGSTMWMSADSSPHAQPVDSSYIDPAALGVSQHYGPFPSGDSQMNQARSWEMGAPGPSGGGPAVSVYNPSAFANTAIDGTDGHGIRSFSSPLRQHPAPHQASFQEAPSADEDGEVVDGGETASPSEEGACACGRRLPRPRPWTQGKTVALEECQKIADGVYWELTNTLFNKMTRCRFTVCEIIDKHLELMAEKGKSGQTSRDL